MHHLYFIGTRMKNAMSEAIKWYQVDKGIDGMRYGNIDKWYSESKQDLWWIYL